MGNPDHDGSKPGEGMKVDVSLLSTSDGSCTPRANSHESKITPHHSLSQWIQSWTAAALLVSYFVFSIAFYTVLPPQALKIFWFLYLAIATIVAGTTAVEAYDGLTPVKEAQKGTLKFEKDIRKLKTSDTSLPPVELIFDLGDEDATHDLSAIKNVRDGLLYPRALISVSVLCREDSQAHVLASDFDETFEAAGVRIHAIPTHAMASLSRRLAYFMSSTGHGAANIVAVYSCEQRPHPHSITLAVERFKDNKIDLIQGRTVRVTQGKDSSLFAALANVEHDMVYALLQPGRAITWGFNVADTTNTYWRTETLRAAASATAGILRNGRDLGFTATSRGAKSVNDLSIVCFEPCARTYPSYLYTQASEAREWVLAAVRYSSLAFKKHATKDGTASGKWTLKTRAAILYELLILRIASHAILQYLSMALGFLFTRTPRSTLAFSYLVYFPYPISEWLMVSGVVCMLATVFMIYQARSEFVPLWTAPVVLVLYPLMLASRAVVDVYAQLDVLVA